MERLNQAESRKLVQTKKAVSWLIDNTTVAVFNPITFEGYQRRINDKHCDAIVDYLANGELFLPTSIICAVDGPYSDCTKLRIVDGQHRIEAFSRLKQQHPAAFDRISNNEISVIVMENANLKEEIETFITINKTPRRVDTSLALVLMNKLNSENPNEVSDKMKRDYLAVEAAKLLNERPSSIWEGRISYDETPSKTSYQLVSLNSFVTNVRSLLRHLGDRGLISYNWASAGDIDAQAQNVADLIDAIWEAAKHKWPELFKGDEANRRIIQGSIGLASISRFICLMLKDPNRCPANMERLHEAASGWIESIDAPAANWMPGSSYSQFTSGSGYSVIAHDLFDLCKSKQRGTVIVN